jgi:hypothetical protein
VVGATGCTWVAGAVDGWTTSTWVAVGAAQLVSSMLRAISTVKNENRKRDFISSSSNYLDHTVLWVDGQRN